MDTLILVTKNVENNYGLFATYIFESKKKRNRKKNIL
jgi:hypothetical protein